MRPSQISTRLNQIARNLDRSSNPSKELVSADLRRVIRATENDPEVQWLESNVREYTPVGPDVAYPTIDGRFKFKLPDGKICQFDGRFDENDQVGTFVCDGQDLTSKLFAEPGDSVDLGFLDENFEGTPLDFMIENHIKSSSTE